MTEEAYPANWAKVTLMVSPNGEMHAIGGDRCSGEGDQPYIGLERIKDHVKLHNEKPPEGIVFNSTSAVLSGGGDYLVLVDYGEGELIVNLQYGTLEKAIEAALKVTNASTCIAKLVRLSVGELG